MNNTESPSAQKDIRTDPFVNEDDFALIDSDKYTFEVLSRILKGKCRLIRSDHRDLIFCHSEDPYPVWIWTPDGCGAAVKAKAWALAALYRPLSEGFCFNMKHDLASYFIRKGRQSGLDVGISRQLFAYDCPEPVKPDTEADGGLYVCTLNDLCEAADMRDAFYEEIGEEAPPRERSEEKIRKHIDDQAMFFWKNGAGVTVACCTYRVNGDMASVGGVLTLKGYRRNHYAQNLVYEVTKRIADAGMLPMLYTDADYPASNACYSKIGYTLRGKLCTVSLL